MINWTKQADFTLTENLEPSTQLSGDSKLSGPNRSDQRDQYIQISLQDVDPDQTEQCISVNRHVQKKS